MNELERKEINEAIQAADDAIMHLESARSTMPDMRFRDSAKNSGM